jgi:hypothetical protein
LLIKPKPNRTEPAGFFKNLIGLIGFFRFGFFGYFFPGFLGLISFLVFLLTPKNRYLLVNMTIISVVISDYL